jgi:hypothetical protein
MKIIVETIESAAQADAAAQIRSEVFGREWQCRIANPMNESKPSLHLLARIQPTGEPISALSVVDTGDTGLHDVFGLPFGLRTRVARYTQLAVLKPYRGQYVPLRMILEAPGVSWRRSVSNIPGCCSMRTAPGAPPYAGCPASGRRATFFRPNMAGCARWCATRMPGKVKQRASNRLHRPARESRLRRLTSLPAGGPIFLPWQWPRNLKLTVGECPVMSAWVEVSE